MAVLDKGAGSVQVGRFLHRFHLQDIANDEINLAGFSRGYLAIPAGSAITALAVHASDNIQAGGTYAAYKDASGTAVSITVAAGDRIELPAAMFPLGWIKLVPTGTGEVFLFAKG